MNTSSPIIMELLDVRHDPGDPERLMGRFTLSDGTVTVTTIREEARPIMERLIAGVSYRSQGDRLCTPDEGEAFLSAIEERYKNSTYYRAVRVALSD